MPDIAQTSFDIWGLKAHLWTMLPNSNNTLSSYVKGKAIPVSGCGGP
jgi:hypothetical protein